VWRADVEQEVGTVVEEVQEVIQVGVAGVTVAARHPVKKIGRAYRAVPMLAKNRPQRQDGIRRGETHLEQFAANREPQHPAPCLIDLYEYMNHVYPCKYDR